MWLYSPLTLWNNLAISYLLTSSSCNAKCQLPPPCLGIWSFRVGGVAFARGWFPSLVLSLSHLTIDAVDVDSYIDLWSLLDLFFFGPTITEILSVRLVILTPKDALVEAFPLMNIICGQLVNWVAYPGLSFFLVFPPFFRGAYVLSTGLPPLTG